MRPTTLLLLLVLCVPALADGKPSTAPKALTPDAVARAVVEALRARDDRALEALAKRQEPDPWLVADALCARGAPDAARRFARRGVRPGTARLARYLERPGDPRAAQRRAAVARLNQHLGRGAWRRALAAAEGLDDAESGVAGIRLAFGRGLALRELGRPAESSAAFVRAGEAAARLGWLLRATISYHRAGRQAHAAGTWQRAHDLWQRAHALAVELEDRALQATTLNNVGVALIDLGHYDEARDANERALAMRRAHGEPQRLAESLVNAAAVRQRLGDYAGAMSALDEALDLAKRADDPRLEGAALRGRGAMRMRLRDPRRALEDHRAALALARRVGTQSDIAGDLDRVGMAYAVLREFGKAGEHYGAALAIQRARGDRHGEARVLQHLGALHVRTSAHGKAAEAFERALSMQQALGDRAGAAATLLRLGALHGEMGAFERADGALAQAQGFLDDIPDADLQMRVHWAQAGVHYGRRAWRACLEHCRQAERIASGLSAGLAQHEAAGAGDEWFGIFDTALRAAVRLPDPERVSTLWHFLESGRAHALREALAARGALSTALIPKALREAIHASRAAQARALADLRAARSRGHLRAMRRARAALREARDVQERVLARVQRHAKAGSAIAYPRPEDLAAVRARLRPDEALVVYGLTERDALALVLTRSESRAVPLGPSTAIEDAVRAVLADPDLVVAQAAIAPLRKRLVAPLQLAPGIRRVLVAPTEALGSVPLALLLPDHEAVFVPSGTSLGLLRTPRAGRGRGVLGLGAPSYGRTASRAIARMLQRADVGRTLPALPATRKEVDAVADVKLLGEEATEAALRSALADRPRWRAVHLACHGLIDGERPLFSALAVTARGADDGLLTCADIFRMRVRADLVTLSACETARGRVYRTDGILGLTHAFMFAGTPRVLASLWKVDDEATRALMVKFYELWNPKDGPGVSAAAALRRAQAFLRGHDKWRHPYYWAAWVLWGLPE